MDLPPTLSSPALADTALLKPSAKFKKAIFTMIGAILLFLIVYLLLFVSALIIAVAMIALGFFLIVNVHHLAVIILGLGLALSSLMLIYFLVKFLFKKQAPATRGFEIKEEDQPLLFSFIRDVTRQTRVPFPKHIYLIHDVNASVFFDSSFWSMLLPVKKNLNIGLGLVNSLNQSEFKAVLAHEFGHFSQSSMRFGSYVYSLNRVLYNLLYDNEDYHKLLGSWGRTHRILAFAANINIKLVEMIQHILRKMYVIINKNYMALSREMEFHADAIAASVGGTNNVISSLRRLEIADDSYQKLLNYWDSKLTENQRSENLYPQHLIVQKNYATELGLPVDEHNLPVIDKRIPDLKDSTITINSLWQSHPSINDRENSVEKLQLIVPPNTESSWKLFNNATELQKTLTEEVYTKSGISGSNQHVNEVSFRERYEQEINTHLFDPAYRGYYDAASPIEFAITDDILDGAVQQYENFDQLFSIENCALPKTIQSLKQDIKTLEYIDIAGEKDIKTFVFKGVSYSAKDAGSVIETINQQINAANAQMADFDQQVFIFFCRRAATQELKNELIYKYQRIFDIRRESMKDYDRYNDIMTDLAKCYHKMSFNAIYDTVNSIYQKEKNFKPRLQEFINREEFKPYLTEQTREAIQAYINTKHIYFSEPSYNNASLHVLNETLNTYVSILDTYNLDIKKDLLDFQLSLLSID
jgi:Zn-dependent protease with chaperone function